MITSLIFSAISSLVPWQQIEIGQNLILNEPITLNQKITLNAGTKLLVSDLIPLDEIQVISYKMNITPCSNSMKVKTSEMVIVNELYGAQLEKDCSLNVYLELKDFSKPSLFSLISK